MTKLMSDNESASESSDSSESECEIEQPKVVKPKKVKESKEPKEFVPDVAPEKPKKRVYTKKAQTAEEAEIVKQKKIDNLAKARATRAANVASKKAAAEPKPSPEKSISKPLKEKKEKKVVNYITNNYVAPVVEEKAKKPKPQRIIAPPAFQFI